MVVWSFKYLEGWVVGGFYLLVPIYAEFVRVQSHLVDVQKGPTIILGIDPGTTIMGYGVVRAWSRNKVELLEMGALHLARVSDHAVKLRRIHDRCAGLIEAHSPDHFAVEAPFFGKNVQSMLKLGRAQGVALAAALVRDVPVAEYAPRRVKKAITGSGSASKEQVAGMVQRTLSIPDADMPRDLDATDGLAVALCHLYEMGTPTLGGKGGGWAAFVRENPDRAH
jgi:crossover junction endodeoxyribonuclease RuvC